MEVDILFITVFYRFPYTKHIISFNIWQPFVVKQIIMAVYKNRFVFSAYMHKQASSVFASVCDCQHFGKFKQDFLIVWEEKASFWCDDLDTKSSVLRHRTGLFFSSLHRDFLYKQFLWMQSSIILFKFMNKCCTECSWLCKVAF